MAELCPNVGSCIELVVLSDDLALLKEICVLGWVGLINSHCKPSTPVTPSARRRALEVYPKKRKCGGIKSESRVSMPA